MNEVIQNILNRRSIKNYSDKQISEDDLSLILKAGQFAPSLKNEQPWHFTVVQDKEIIDILNIDIKRELVTSDNPIFVSWAKDPNFNMFYNAPTIIIVSGEESWLSPITPCAAATENMLLAAESLGLGSCWIGVISVIFIKEKVAKYIELLQIPEKYEPFYAVALGYRKGEIPEPDPRREGVVNYIR